MEKNAASSLENTVKDIIKKLGSKAHVGEDDMKEAWESAAGANSARHSRPARLEKGALVVNVDSSGWLYELTVEKKEILARLKEKLDGTKLKDIRFRIGEIK